MTKIQVVVCKYLKPLDNSAIFIMDVTKNNLNRIRFKGASLFRGDETDEILMALYQDGAEEAFASLYNRHSGKVFGYLKSRVRSEQDAKDLFQEVFIKIHKSKHLYNRTLPVLPWIFSVTHSVLIGGTRKADRKNEVLGFNFDKVPAQEEIVSRDLAPRSVEIGGLSSGFIC